MEHKSVVEIIESIPSSGGKIRSMSFVAVSDNGTEITTITAIWENNGRFIIQVSTKEPGMGSILEKLMALFDHQDTPDLFWLSDTSKYYCWLGEQDSKEKVEEEFKLHAILLNPPSPSE